ncbi:DUF3291 domain-containing protein [Maribacter antarcticus]
MWIPAGDVPSLELTKEKLEHYQKYGETPQAFSMRSLFDAQGNAVKLSES